jgi:hypothetical protein
MKVYNWLSGLRPKMIEVHHYRVLDPATEQWVVPPLKCTAAAISRLKGLIIAGTMQIVARASLDKEGCYDPKQSRKEPP